MQTLTHTQSDRAAPAPAAPAVVAAPPLRALTRDMLTWLAESPRTYDEAMAAWRTSCPRLSIWEDALDDGLIRLESGGRGADTLTVAVTPLGLAALGRG